MYTTLNSTIDLPPPQRRRRRRWNPGIMHYWILMSVVLPSLFSLCFHWSSVRGLSLWGYFTSDGDGRATEVSIDWKCHPVEKIYHGTFSINVSNCASLIATRVFIIVFLVTSCAGILLSFYVFSVNPNSSFKTRLGVCLFHALSTLCGLAALLSASYWLPSTRFERESGDSLTVSFDPSATAIVCLLISVCIEIFQTLVCGIYTCRIRYSRTSNLSPPPPSVVSSLLPVEDV